MKHILLGLMLLFTSTIFAQVGVGTTTPETSAMLEAKSSSKGFLPPRLTYAQRQAISSPATGLIIYCTNCGQGEPQFYNGTAWVNMIGGTALTQPPTVSTTAASNITSSTATSGGNITNDFGYTITARGVCWSTSQSPTTADSKTTESGTTGIFTSNISGLNRSTLYYVRAYATSAGGTSYGAQVSFTTSALGIGDSYQGGIVAYILQPGDPGYDANVRHGFVATAYDVSVGAVWGCFNFTINGADGTAIGTGNQNTIDIMNGCGTPGIAARICGDLVLNGYSDWYLPSKDELNQLYLNRVAIGGFADYYYWSSTESDFFGAWSFLFSTGTADYTTNKDNTFYVRAVRAFSTLNVVLPTLTTTVVSAFTGPKLVPT